MNRYAFIETLDEHEARMLAVYVAGINPAVFNTARALLERDRAALRHWLTTPTGTTQPTEPVSARECSRCDGFGIEFPDGTPHTCSICHGKGRLTDDHPAPPPPAEPDTPEPNQSAEPEPPATTRTEPQHADLPPELRLAATSRYLGGIITGTIPGIRRIKTDLRVGQDRAQQVQAYLTTLAAKANT